ncbi:MAG: hypothetical protein ACO27F_06660 [Beijerinckiaceae bacterium]
MSGSGMDALAVELQIHLENSVSESLRRSYSAPDFADCDALTIEKLRKTHQNLVKAAQTRGYSARSFAEHVVRYFRDIDRPPELARQITNACFVEIAEALHFSMARTPTKLRAAVSLQLDAFQRAIKLLDVAIEAG